VLSVFQLNVFKLILSCIQPEHKIQSSGELDLKFSHTPKMLGPLTREWAPEAFIVTFKVVWSTIMSIYYTLIIASLSFFLYFALCLPISIIGLIVSNMLSFVVHRKSWLIIKRIGTIIAAGFFRRGWGAPPLFLRILVHVHTILYTVYNL